MCLKLTIHFVASRRKRGEKGEVVETVEDVIVRRLTADRIDELKRLIKDTQETHRYTGAASNSAGKTKKLRQAQTGADAMLVFSQEAEERSRADSGRTPRLQTPGIMGGNPAVRGSRLSDRPASMSCLFLVCGCQMLVPHHRFSRASVRKKKQEEEEAELKRKNTDAAYQGIFLHFYREFLGKSCRIVKDPQM